MYYCQDANVYEKVTSVISWNCPPRITSSPPPIPDSAPMVLGSSDGRLVTASPDNPATLDSLCTMVSVLYEATLDLGVPKQYAAQGRTAGTAEALYLMQESW